MNPAEQLVGMSLPGDWNVTDFAARKPNSTGGHFSHGYLVENRDGRKGFLKAMDYSRAMSSDDTARVLQAMTSAYNFERDLCLKCTHLSRVVRAIDAGSIHIDTSKFYTKVEYLIFERADCDIRVHLDVQDNIDNAFLMRTLHNVATGLSQLHRARIAHQDLKPSNVLVYDGVGSKICDLGRAWDQELPSPHDGCQIAGDRNYAPIESWYGAAPTDQLARRFGCDFYHLGSLLIFLYTRTHTNALLIGNLHVDHRPYSWSGTYEEALPFVHAAFDITMSQFANTVPHYLRDQLVSIARELCNPDPYLRGVPGHSTTRFSLERYISRFDRLAHVARLHSIA